MDARDLVLYGAIGVNLLACVVNLTAAWRHWRTERLLRELSLWACMVEDEPEERER